MSAKRNFGTIRQLPSGRWQARHRDPTKNRLIAAPSTFATKKEGSNWLSKTEADIARAQWINPRVGDIAFAGFANQWLANHPSIRPRTRENYESILRLHVLPVFGAQAINKIGPGAVRRWHADLVHGTDLHPSTVAKIYRLVHAIFETAVADEVIAKNPCAIKGAAVDKSEERTVLTVAELTRLIESSPPRYQALIRTAAMTGLRLGELLALTRRHVDLDKAVINVSGQLQELASGKQFYGPTKTHAGRRSVALPSSLVEHLYAHIAKFADPGPDGHIFTAPNGGPMRRGNFRKRVWLPALERSNLVGTRFHDLRHTGNTIAAATGASTKELMARMGHSSSRAALVYQHATEDRDRAIADGIERHFTNG